MSTGQMRGLMAGMLALGLVACGSDTADDATQADALSEGAGFVGLVATLLSNGDVAAGKSLGFATTSTGHKAAVTTNCDAGGTVSHDAETGRTEYSQCVTRYVQGDYVLTSTVDGVEISRETGCPEGGCEAQTRYYRDQYGENGAPLTAENSDSNGEDVISTLLLDDEYSITELAEGSAYTSVLDGVVTNRDRARGGPELRLVYQQTRFAEAETSTGYSLEIDGAFSANAGAISPGCGQGAVIFETTTPIEFDSSNALIAGALNLQLSEDRIVQVRVEQGVFVLESEGASRRYSVGELQQLCS